MPALTLSNSQLEVSTVQIPVSVQFPGILKFLHLKFKLFSLKTTVFGVYYYSCQCLPLRLCFLFSKVCCGTQLNG